MDDQQTTPTELTTIQKIRVIYGSTLWQHLEMMYIESGLKKAILKAEQEESEYVLKIILDAMLKTIDRYIAEKVFLR